MRFEIKNFRGCAHADIVAESITMVTGRNGSGKTSIMQGIAALLTGDPMPIVGVAKNAAQRLVRSGTGAGNLFSEYLGGSSEISYPECKYVTEGTPAVISEHAAGTDSVLNYPAKERADILSRIIGALPTIDDLRAELRKIYPEKIADQTSDAVWKMIEVSDWNAAVAHCSEKNSRDKGKWEAITRERYGSKKADGWIPESWDQTLSTATEESLVSTWKLETEYLEAAIAENSAADSMRGELIALAGTIPKLEANLFDLRGQYSALEENKKLLNEALKKLPPAKNPPVTTCPHCKKNLQIIGDKLEIPTIIEPAVFAKRLAAITEANKSIEELSAHMQTVSKMIDSANSELFNAQRAKTKIDNMSQPTSEPSNPKNVEECRVNTARAAARLDAFRARRDAAALIEQIKSRDKLIAVLKSDGLRETKLIKSMDWFNGELKKFSDGAGWAVVCVARDMSIDYNNTPYMLLSESEKFRVRITLQLTIATIQESTAVIIDAADILDAAGRNGLVRTIHKVCRSSSVHPKVIIAMTISDE